MAQQGGLVCVILLRFFCRGAVLVIFFGMLGSLGIELSIPTSLIGSIILGIAIDDTVHLTVSYRRLRSAGYRLRPSKARPHQQHNTNNALRLDGSVGWPGLEAQISRLGGASRLGGRARGLKERLQAACYQ